ncbi:hypothetical protein N9S60_00145, partial [bacterium]|nr:hypothetical protein [bacterium]
LVNIITPLVIEGIKSIFKEALELCIVNDEKEKYLMTFQNFLTRVPKWNQSIIDSESERIIKKSGCSYLEDLISCVHISQLKILTSIRVSNKQKKVEIDIPKVNDFIHKIYIKFARKLYSNVYLFETTIPALQIQKNNRECELICKECILNVIRQNIPVDKILRAYIDETEEEEVINETTLQETVAEPVEEKNVIKEEIPVKIENPIVAHDKNTEEPFTSINKITNIQSENTLVKSSSTPVIKTLSPKPSIISAPKLELPKNLQLKINTDNSSPKQTNKISFSDTDKIKEYNVSSTPKSSNNVLVNNVVAPKTIKRLEEISVQRNIQRKLEEEEEEEEEEKLKIFDTGPSLKLETLDITSLSPLKSPIKSPKKDINSSLLNIETLN